MNFLWVRWLELVEPGSWDLCRLDRVSYVTKKSTIDAFGFIDPSTVIRASHLIPAFSRGRVPDSGPTKGSDSPDGDWESYYINR